MHLKTYSIQSSNVAGAVRVKLDQGLSTIVLSQISKLEFDIVLVSQA
jgi:hypothetical protein